VLRYAVLCRAVLCGLEPEIGKLAPSPGVLRSCVQAVNARLEAAAVVSLHMQLPPNSNLPTTRPYIVVLFALVVTRCPTPTNHIPSPPCCPRRTKQTMA